MEPTLNLLIFFFFFFFQSHSFERICNFFFLHPLLHSSRVHILVILLWFGSKLCLNRPVVICRKDHGDETITMLHAHS